MNAREFIRRLQNKQLHVPEQDNLSLLSCSNVQELEGWINTNTSDNSRFALVKCLENRCDNEIIVNIKSGAPIIAISHQPTLFAYSGVYVQFILAEYITKYVFSKNRPVRPVVVYLCLDGDDALDRRIKTAHIPNPSVNNGTIALSYPVSRSYKNKPQYSGSLITESSINKWIEQLNGSFGHLIKSSPLFKVELKSCQKKMIALLKRICESTLKGGVTNYAEFSKSILLTFTREMINSPVIEVNYSELISYGKEEFISLLKRWDEIKVLCEHRFSELESYGIDTKLFSSMKRNPAWAVCPNCQYKNAVGARESLLILNNQSIYQSCVECNSNLAKGKVLPRVLLEDVLGAVLLDSTLTLTYAGSSPHVLLSAMIFPEIANRPSPIYTWHPKQFLGGVLDRVEYEISRQKSPDSPLFMKNKLASLGRDPLLCTAELDSLKYLAFLWGKHFESKSLTEVMVPPEAESLWEQIKLRKDIL